MAKPNRIIYVGELERTPDAPDHRGIIQGFQELGVDYRIVDPVLRSPDEVVEACNSWPSDLIIHGNTDSLSNGTIPRISGHQVFFMGDCRIDGDYPWDEWVRGSGGLSQVFISNRSQLELWEEKLGLPSTFWPHGSFVPDKLERDERFRSSVLFIGTHHDSYPFNERAKLISAIASGLQYPVEHINGYGVEGRNQVWREMPIRYHSSDTVLDISHFWTLDGYASGRYWYSAGLGGCSVTKRFPGCDEFYEDKKEKWYFDTSEEAIDTITTLIANPDIIERTKLAAYERNKRSHRYSIRFQQLFDALK